jgi:hypothetical protein
MGRGDGGKRLGRPTDAAASRENVVLFCGIGNHVVLRGLPGFEPMAIGRCYTSNPSRQWNRSRDIHIDPCGLIWRPRIRWKTRRGSMYISCLATDYDGTLAHNGMVDDATAEALVAFRRSARRLLLVTGRELPDLTRVFPRIDLFDRIVAENGACSSTPRRKRNRS